MDQVVARNAAATPDRSALLFGESALTWGELEATVDRAARGLRAMGVEAGDAVGVLMGAGIEHVIAVYAAWRAGAVWIPLNPQLHDRDLAHCVATAAVRLILVDGALAERVTGSSEPEVAATRALALEELPSGTEAPLPPVQADDDAVIAFTSGTTGRSKGVALRHRALRVHSEAVVAHYGMSERDVVLNLLPLHMLSIFLVGPALAAECGSRCRILPRYGAVAFAEAVRRDRTTIAAAVPVLFADLNELPADEAAGIDLSSLRIVSCGGAPLDDTVRRRFEQRFDFRIVQAFGGTEAPGIVATDPLDADPRPGSVGRALPHVRITAIDDAWNELPPGEMGDLCTGPASEGELAGAYEPMRAYVGQPDATHASLRDGRLRWGDVGYVDDDGFVFLVDRRVDVIIRGGMNIYPRQLELAAGELPDIAECVVVGRPDARLGEVPVAFVRPSGAARIDPESVARRISDRVPRYAAVAQVLVVDDLPRNALGKVLKRELRARLTEAGAEER